MNEDFTNAPQRRYPLRDRKPKVIVSMLSALSTDNLTQEPETVSEALNSAEAVKLKKAMDEEYESLIENETWVLTSLPSDRRAIKCKWVFKIKSGLSDMEERFKAR